MKPENEPTPEELREAEALARALEGDDPATHAPIDVAATAALLRTARHEKLDAAWARATGDSVARTIAERRRRSHWWAWLVPPLAAAAVAALWLWPLRPQAPAGIPTPPSTLLAAQAAAARGAPRGLDTLEQEMRAYRRAIFSQVGRGRP